MEKNTNEDFIRQRIRLYIKAKNINEHQFCKAVGVPTSYIAMLVGSIRSDTFTKIILFYTDLNPYWLLCGKGKMLLEEGDKPFFTPPPRNFLLLQKLKTETENLAQQIEACETQKIELRKSVAGLQAKYTLLGAEAQKQASEGKEKE